MENGEWRMENEKTNQAGVEALAGEAGLEAFAAMP
jgi:hypothetical protein